MENIKSIQDFLILPDWIKVQLKMNEKHYSTYPFMTDEEEHKRKEKIYLIASHFSQISFENLTENPNYSLDNTWPYTLEKFITPRLLGMAPIELWCTFGHCLFCAHWKGYKKTHYKLVLKRVFCLILKNSKTACSTKFDVFVPKPVFIHSEKLLPPSLGMKYASVKRALRFISS